MSLLLTVPWVDVGVIRNASRRLDHQHFFFQMGLFQMVFSRDGFSAVSKL